MNAKLLAALAAAAAITLGAVLFLTRSGEPGDPDGMNGAPTADSATGNPDDPTPSELSALEGQPSTAARAEALSGAPASDPGSGLASAGDAAGSAASDPDATTLEVSIEWPAGSTPTEDVVIYAFPRRVQGGSLARAMSSDSDSITYERQDSGPLAEVRSVEDSNEELLASAYAAVPAQAAEAAADGTWGVTIYLPRGVERAFLHAFGGGFGTEEAVEAKAADGTVTLRPTSLGSLVVNATSKVAGAELEGSFAHLKVDVSGAAMMGMGSSQQSRFRSDRGLDADGRTEFVGAPTGSALKIRLLHDRLAPLEAEIEPLSPGETRQITVELGEGLTVSGRVVDAEGVGLEEATVSASLPGKVFGFDDTVFRTTTSGLNGAFELVGLPSSTVVVRAERTGALQSKRIRIDPVTSNEVESLTLTLETGKSIEGTARFEDGTPAVGVVVAAAFDVAHLAGPSGLGATRGASNQSTVDAEGKFAISGLGSGPFRLKAESASDATNGESSLSHVARMDGVRPGRTDVELILRPATAVRGSCIDDQGTPVIDEWITLHRLVPGSMGDVRLDRQRKKTNEEGAFTFTGVTPGEWTISVASDRHVTPEEIKLDVAESDATEVLVNVMRTVTVTGLVIDPDGQPIGGARVSQASDEAPWKRALSGVVMAEGTTSADDGTFSLVGVLPGEARVTAVSDDFAPATTEPLTAEPGTTVSDITLRLSRGSTIEGVCFDKDGRTANSRLITIQSMSMQVMRTLSTDAGGTFKQTGLTPGRYQVIAMDPSADMSDDVDGAGMTAMLENMNMAMVSLDEGETEFIYLGAPPASPVKVTGEVTMGGEPQAGVMVAWLPAADGMYDKMKLATTDEDGKYEVTLDDSGDYLINVTNMKNAAIGQQRTTEFKESVPKQAETLARDLELPGGTISGRVVTSDGGPAGGVRLTVTGTGGVRTDQMMGGSYAETMTKPDGSFEIQGLGAGSYRVLAGGATPLNDARTAPSRVMSRDLRLSKNGRVDDLTIALVEPGSVEVRVTGAGGEAVTGANVFLRDTEGRHTELISLNVSNAAGLVTLRGIAPGEYTAAARTELGASPESAVFEVRAGATSNVALAMQPGAFVVATIRVKGDGDVPPAEVQVLDSTGKDVTRRVGMTDFQAKYADRPFSLTEHRVGPIAPGRYTILATSPDGRKGKRRVNLAPGDERTVSLLIK